LGVFKDCNYKVFSLDLFFKVLLNSKNEGKSLENYFLLLLKLDMFLVLLSKFAVLLVLLIPTLNLS